MTSEPEPLPPEVDDLFQGPPGDFIKARDQMAKQLKADKQADAAKAVKSLRRPTLAAWGVNQLAHQDRAELEALFAITAELSDEQDRAVRGRGEADRMRALTQKHRAAIAELADRAAAHLDALSGSGAAQREEIVAAIERATTDPTVHLQVMAGRLSVIPEADPMTAFGGLLSSDVLASLPARPEADRNRDEPATTEAKTEKPQSDVPGEHGKQHDEHDKKTHEKHEIQESKEGAATGQGGADESDDASERDAAARAAIEAARADLDARQTDVETAHLAVEAAEERDAAAERRVDEAKATLEALREERVAVAETLRQRRRDERDARAALGKAERKLRALEPD